MTLTPAGSPYTGGPTIESGATVTIEPGTELETGRIVVKGTLDAEGSSESPIVFNGNQWGGIVFEPGSGSSILSYAELNKAGWNWGEAIKVKGSSPQITHSVIRESTYYGIFVEGGGSPEIDHNTITHSGGMGVYYGSAGGNSGELNIHDNTIDHSGGGSRALYVEISGESGENITATSLGGNKLENNSGAIYYNGGELAPDIDENTASENGAGNNLAIGGFLAQSATWTDPGARIYLLSQGITIAKASTLAIKAGAEFEGEGAFTVKGTMKAEGSAEDPVVFERQEYWAHFHGIIFEPGSGASVLDHVEVIKAGWNWEPAITVNHASPHITNSVIKDSTRYGIFVEGGGSPEIDHNTITGSSGIGLYYGSAAGNSGELNIHDNTIENGHASNSALFIEISGESGENITATSLGGNTVKGNYEGGIYYNGGELAPDIDENMVVENGQNTIWIGGVLRQSATWSDPGVPIQLSNSNLQIAKGTTLSADPGLILEGGGGVIVKGALKAEGTAEDPVLFRKQAGVNYFRGLIYESASGESALEYAEVRQAGFPWEPAVTVDHSSPHIAHSTIRESTYYGIFVKKGGSPEIDHNTITKSVGIGLYYGEPAGNTGEINIHDNRIEKGYASNSSLFIEISGSGGENITSTTLGGNVIAENNGGGLYFNAVENEIAPDIYDNEILTNAENNLTFSGVLKKSTTWTGSRLFPLELTNSGLTIPKGVTLALKPGVTIEGGGRVLVEGTLKAEGSAELPVLFRKGHAYNSFAGLEFKSGSSASILDHVDVAKAGGNWGHAILIDGVSPHITNSIIRESVYYGIFVEGGGSPEIDHNLITHSSGIALYYGSAEGKSGEVNIHDNRLEYNYTSNAPLYVETSGEGGENVTATSLGGNTIAYNQDAGIYLNGGEVPPDIDENTLVSNKFDSIRLGGVLAQSATWTDYGSPIEVTNLEIASGSTLTATQGLSFEGGTFRIKGTLKAEGTWEEPVVFQPQGESDWRGLLFETGGSSSVLKHAEVVGGGNGEAAITIKGSSPTITDSVFRHSDPKAIAVESGSPVIEYNAFRDNPYGLTYGGEGTFSAPHNDWQCNPESKSCGNLVGENVEWKPDAELFPHKPPCVAGAQHPGPRPDCLLYRYEPELVFDTAERFHPDSAAEIVENWGDEGGIWGEDWISFYGNRLLDGDATEEIVSYAGPAGGEEFHLDLEALDTKYPNGEEADGNDWLVEEIPPGNEEEVVDAQQDVAIDLEARGFSDHSYALLREDGGHTWLEYWYWYYYNNHEFHEAGLHEGDWESILIRLDSESKPDLAVFSQHEGQGKCAVESKELDLTKAGAPISYVAKGSHANYFKPGKYELVAGFDNANGEGWHITPKLENLGRTQPSWLEWPGHWGNSRGITIPFKGTKFTSPTGPAQHQAWSEPAAYAASATSC